MPVDIEELDIKRLELKRSEVLIVRVDGRLSAEEMSVIASTVQRAFPNNTVLVVEPEMTFEAVDATQV